MAMQTYVSRSLQSGVKLTSDKLLAGSATDPAGTLYEPYYLQSHNTASVSAHNDTDSTGVGGSQTTVRGLATTTRFGTEIIHGSDEQPVNEQ